MQNPCPIEISCPCADGNPLAGNSSEAPDLPTFTGSSFQSLIPPLGTDWLAYACGAIFVSNVSQEEADLLAAAAALQCITGVWNNPVNGNPNPSPLPPVPPAQGPVGGAPYPSAGNTEQLGTAFCDDGNEFVYTVPAGLFWGLTQEIANAAALSYGNTQAELLKTCLSDIAGMVCQGEAYNQTITATGMDIDEGANNWELVSGALPPGITFAGSGSTAVLSGTPTALGTFNFTISVTGMDGGYVQKFYTLVVAGISNLAELPAGQLNQPYSFQLTAVGFTDPIFSVAAGSALPPGLTMDDSGLISGTPTSASSSATVFEVQENDSGAFLCSGTGTITVTGGCGAIPNVTHTLSLSLFTGAGTAVALVSGGAPQLFLPSTVMGDPAYLWNLSAFTSQTTTTDGTFDCSFACYAPSTGKLWTLGNPNTTITEFTVSPFAQSGRSLTLNGTGETSPNGISYNSNNGMLYVVNVNSLFTVNPTSAVQVGVYSVPNTNDGLQNTAAFDPATGHVFVGFNQQASLPLFGALLVFDNSSTPVLLHTWKLPDSGSGTIPLSVQFCPMNGYVYVLNQDQGDGNEIVTVVDPATGNIIEQIILPNPTAAQYNGGVPVFNVDSNLMIIPTEFGAATICVATNTMLGYVSGQFFQGVYIPSLIGAGFVDISQSPIKAEILVS
jgi:Putative Ig domain